MNEDISADIRTVTVSNIISYYQVTPGTVAIGRLPVTPCYAYTGVRDGETDMSIISTYEGIIHQHHKLDSHR